MEKDIRKAHTPEGEFYHNKDIYNFILEEVFVPSWQFIGHEQLTPEAGYACPVELLPGSLNEPLVLVRDKDMQLRCMSNVCTHRGMILVEQAGSMRMISCGYHGRCFRLDGSFKSMPEFEEAENFPSETDHLTNIPLGNLGNLLFTSITPKIDFETMIQPIKERLFWFPFDQLEYDQETSEEYTVNANWALYCDNYLEGFHVPFVHPGLGANLDYKNYSTELFDYCNLQLGVADPDAAAFELPPDAKDYGKRIHAYYWWIFPNIMLNIYTWGISVNVVEPQGVHQTKVRFLTYLLPDKKAGFSKEMLHQTEMEDEAVVESVQKGLKSRLYQYGRYSPKREQCVHHFHSLLANFLDDE